MDEKKQEEFEVVDKRRVSAAEAEAAAEPEQPEPEEEVGAAGDEGMPDVGIHELIGSFLGMLHGFAWQKMGFMANPKTGKIEKDLPEAKIAIDTMQLLAGQLEKGLPENEVRELRRLMMDMQMNYLRQSGSGS